MKSIFLCLLLSSSVTALAEEEVHRFVFPPFASKDLRIPSQPLPDDLTYDDRKAIPVEDLRGIMAYGNPMDQGTAVQELMERGDQETVLRLVYSLKQGNVLAKGILSRAKSLAVIPYLMEDVANGSLAYYGAYVFGDGGYGASRLRVAVVDVVDTILFVAPEFSEDVSENLKAICRGHEDRVQGLSDESRYLVQWWLLNESAFETGKWDEIRPLSQEITYLDPREDKLIPRDEEWDPEMQPPFGSPAWELAEPFEKWSERIVDPQRRNLDFVALSWDGKRVIEHPAKSLDPRGRPLSLKDREARRSPAQMNLPESESGDGVKGIAWITGAAVLIVVLAILWWMRRRFAAEV